MSRQYFRELLEPTTLASLTAVTGVTAETALWPVSPWTAFPANTARAGQAFKLSAMGVMTTAASPGNLTITPRWGTTTGGVTFGASSALAMTASLSNFPWILQAWLMVRSVGATGSAVLAGTFESGVLSRDMNFGGTVATIDTTAAAGLFIGATPGATTVSLTPLAVILEALN